MVEQQKKEIELPKIRRVPSSWDGKVIDYLLNHRSRKAATDLAMEAIVSYWLVEALEGNVDEEEFRQACRAAVENLSKKLTSIQQMSGSNTITSVPSFAPPILPIPQPVITQTPLQQQEEDDDEDEWDMNIQLTDDLMAVNQALKEVN